MPKMSYYAAPLPGVNIEVVALDTNIVDHRKTCPWIACGEETCTENQETMPGCNLAKCRATLDARASAAFDLLKERIQAAEAAIPRRQLVVVTHYPTTWLKWWRKGHEFLQMLKNPRVNIAFFGGHVHATDNVTNVDKTMRRHGWNDYCVGGGGGWACDNAHTGVSQGFVTGVVQGCAQSHLRA
jgi:prepilin-type processing-associated H-X9-DG protein